MTAIISDPVNSHKPVTMTVMKMDDKYKDRASFV